MDTKWEFGTEKTEKEDIHLIFFELRLLMTHSIASTLGVIFTQLSHCVTYVEISLILLVFSTETNYF